MIITKLHDLSMNVFIQYLDIVLILTTHVFREFTRMFFFLVYTVKWMIITKLLDLSMNVFIAECVILTIWSLFIFSLVSSLVNLFRSSLIFPSNSSSCFSYFALNSRTILWQSISCHFTFWDSWSFIHTSIVNSWRTLPQSHFLC